MLKTVASWVDSYAGSRPEDDIGPRRVDWIRMMPFVGMHVGCLFLLTVGWSPIAIIVAAALYAFRMFAITGFFHRYFSHKSFKTSRPMQFVFAVLGMTCVQRGPLWWAALHREHHRSADQNGDIHSPVVHGFLWSHVGWLLSRLSFRSRLELVPDLAKYPELRFLDRWFIIVPALFAASLYGVGEWLPASLGTSGWQLLVWGFFVSTVLVYHASFTINSLAHRWGKRRYKTTDDSRNNGFLALLTFGEGWHNNHHHFPSTVRQGFFWWEIDITWYLLVVMSWFGLIWDLKPVPERVRLARIDA